MASNNGNTNGNSPSPDDIVCRSLTVMKQDKETAESGQTAGETSQQSKESARGYKICCLDRAKETNGVYQDLLTCIVLGQYKKTEIVQRNIDDYIKKDADIEKLISESSKLLADLCTKISEAHGELCIMTKCVNDKVFPKSLVKKRENGDDETPDKVKKCLKELNDKTNALKEKGDNAAESVVVVAGIQTFTNTDSLKDFAVKLMEKMKKFKECTEANIKSTEEEVKAIRTELNTVVEELAQIECDTATQGAIITGLETVIDFICDCDCDGECLDLCAEFDKCCGESEEGPKQKQSPKKTRDKN